MTCSKKLVFFLACLFLFMFSANLVAGDSDKVQLRLYYESLCSSCRQFMTNELVKIYDSDLHTITDLKLVPFGNSHVSEDGTITCQHGEEECKLNAIEACAIHALPNPKLHFDFIRCVETQPEDWTTCVKDTTSEKAINDCYNGDLSKKLILGYANLTMSLKPPHRFVPWLTLNGKPLVDDYFKFVALVCKAYKGKVALPKICESSASSKSKESKLQVSYAN